MGTMRKPLLLLLLLLGKRACCVHLKNFSWKKDKWSHIPNDGMHPYTIILCTCILFKPELYDLLSLCPEGTPSILARFAVCICAAQWRPPTEQTYWKYCNGCDSSSHDLRERWCAACFSGYHFQGPWKGTNNCTPRVARISNVILCVTGQPSGRDHRPRPFSGRFNSTEEMFSTCSMAWNRRFEISGGGAGQSATCAWRRNWRNLELLIVGTFHGVIHVRALSDSCTFFLCGRLSLCCTSLNKIAGVRLKRRKRTVLSGIAFWSGICGEICRWWEDNSGVHPTSAHFFCTLAFPCMHRSTGFPSRLLLSWRLAFVAVFWLMEADLSWSVKLHPATAVLRHGCTQQGRVLKHTSWSTVLHYTTSTRHWTFLVGRIRCGSARCVEQPSDSSLLERHYVNKSYSSLKAAYLCDSPLRHALVFK